MQKHLPRNFHTMREYYFPLSQPEIAKSKHLKNIRFILNDKKNITDIIPVIKLLIGDSSEVLAVIVRGVVVDGDVAKPEVEVLEDIFFTALGTGGSMIVGVKKRESEMKIEIKTSHFDPCFLQPTT